MALEAPVSWCLLSKGVFPRRAVMSSARQALSPSPFLPAEDGGRGDGRGCGLLPHLAMDLHPLTSYAPQRSSSCPCLHPNHCGLNTSLKHGTLR